MPQGWLPHFQFPPLRKNEAHVWRHDAYDLRAIAAGAIYTLLTGNPVQEAALRHDCSPSDVATAAASFRCNTTDDDDPLDDDPPDPALYPHISRR